MCGRVFLVSRIWPNTVRDSGNANFLRNTGSDKKIRKRVSPNFWHGMRYWGTRRVSWRKFGMRDCRERECGIRIPLPDLAYSVRSRRLSKPPLQTFRDWPFINGVTGTLEMWQGFQPYAMKEKINTPKELCSASAALRNHRKQFIENLPLSPQRKKIMSVKSFWRHFIMFIYLLKLKMFIKSLYYSFKIFPLFWLAKSTRLIHHNQFLMTKFGRILTLTRKWRQKCSVFAG